MSGKLEALRLLRTRLKCDLRTAKDILDPAFKELDRDRDERQRAAFDLGYKTAIDNLRPRLSRRDEFALKALEIVAFHADLSQEGYMDDIPQDAARLADGLIAALAALDSEAP